MDDTFRFFFFDRSFQSLYLSNFQSKAGWRFFVRNVSADAGEDNVIPFLLTRSEFDFCHRIFELRICQMVLRGDVILTWEGMSFSLGYYMTCVRIEAVLAYFYMQILVQYLPYIQIVLSVLLAAGVLVQQSAAGLGGAFGDNFS